MTKREIDDATFVRAFGAQPRPGPDLDRWQSWRFAVAAYLAELPESVPARDRIAVLVTPLGVVGVSGQNGTINENYWRDLADDAMTYFGAELHECTRAIVRCNLPPLPQPIEVDGNVEEVGG